MENVTNPENKINNIGGVNTVFNEGYDRNKVVSQARLRTFREQQLDGKKGTTDPLTGEKIYKGTHHNESKNINVDHVVPAKTVHTWGKSLGLSDKQIRNIANTDGNLWLINSTDNKKKNCNSNFKMGLESLQEGNLKKAATWTKQGVVSTAEVGGKIAVSAAENKINDMISK